MTLRLAGKTAIVTGAGNGIGAAIAERFAAEGANVVVADRDVAAAERVAERVTNGGATALAVHVDVAVETDLDMLAELATATFGSIDVFVNNAGISGRRLGDGRTDAIPLHGWNAVHDVNLTGVFLGCRVAVRTMLGQGRGGAIVNLSSAAGLIALRPPFDQHAYASSKAGVVGLTRSMAVDYAEHRIRVNAIAPGFIETDINRHHLDDPDVRSTVERVTPLPFLGQPSDVASAALFLASDDARFVTGVVLPVDGGWTAH